VRRRAGIDGAILRAAFQTRGRPEKLGVLASQSSDPDRVSRERVVDGNAGEGGVSARSRDRSAVSAPARDGAERKYSKWQFEGGCQAEKRGAKVFLGSEETRPYLSRSADSTFSSSNDLLRCSLKPARGGRKKGEIRPSVPRRASSTSSSGRLIVSRSVVAHERPTGRGRGPRVGHGPDPTETPALYAVPHAPGVTPGV
jgi:hypothetical protein